MEKQLVQIEYLNIEENDEYEKLIEKVVEECFSTVSYTTTGIVVVQDYSSVGQLLQKLLLYNN